MEVYLHFVRVKVKGLNTPGVSPRVQSGSSRPLGREYSFDNRPFLVYNYLLIAGIVQWLERGTHKP